MNLPRLIRDRRSAIAMIFALSLIPMSLMVGLSIDYSFYVQARSQAALAADAAATHAVRATDQAYAYEQSAHDANAAADAEAAGASIGAAWFNATLGNMSRAAISGANNPLVNVTANPGSGAGFTASVSFTGSYPPFFGGLFKNRSPWHLNSAASATSSYSYVEILMLLDNSASMLLGATPADIQTLEEISVCPPATIDPSFTGNGWTAYYQQEPDPNNPLGTLDLPSESLIKNYVPGAYSTSNDGSYGSATGAGYKPGYCETATTTPASADGVNYNYPWSPFAPCAFACHTTTNAMPGYPQYSNDYYGLARKNGVTLRLDIVQQAAAQVIDAMQQNQQVPNQFSVGVYQFNADVAPLVQGPVSNGYPTEATNSLAAAVTAVQNAAVPIVYSSGTNTWFPTSLQNLISGQNGGGTFGAPLSASGNGLTAATPQKDIFIVTDGMEDDNTGGVRHLGQMVGVTAETTGQPFAACTYFGCYSYPALCYPLKQTLGYTVYVLYIDWLPIANTWYYTNYPAYAPAYTFQDYPALANTIIPNYAQVTATSQAANNSDNYSPDEQALQACASSPSDFFEAKNAADIGTAMNSMLRAALTSSIQITQ